MRPEHFNLLETVLGEIIIANRHIKRATNQLSCIPECTFKHDKGIAIHNQLNELTKEITLTLSHGRPQWQP